MKTVILCGGLGTRLSEQTYLKPKPMVDIGDKPMLWHIMNIYGAYNFTDFILATGYKGEVIKEYFLNYYHFQSDLKISLKTKEVQVIKKHPIDWNVHLVDTGSNTMTGGRLLRLKDILKNETFMLTYGDGVSNINIKKLVAYHKSHGKIATVTAVKPIARFGGMSFDGDKVVSFKEKTQTSEGWINGGFFVFEPKVFKYLHGDDTILERDPLENLTKDGQLMAYKHEGFWQCMDTMRDRDVLNELCESGRAPWRIWE
ncbi:MAG: glucose-1-phosphate cytidylyltransferase [Elusimicrobia bacterium]|nr:glucose-1-phosphate cytidylyltransferase [Elusimicrobiota bacterium]